jgi:hypothetical protein
LLLLDSMVYFDKSLLHLGSLLLTRRDGHVRGCLLLTPRFKSGGKGKVGNSFARYYEI